MSKAVVLVSGGIDSAVCLAIAAEQYDVIHPIHVQYGQQTQELERQMAYNQCEHIAREKDVRIRKTPVIEYSDVFSHFAEGVASDRDSFMTDEGDLIEKDGRSTGYVPMRNLHLIATGAGVADHEDADAVFIGAQAGDEEAYPDCRPEFLTHAKRAVDESLPAGESVLVRYPLVGKTKVEVIEKGAELGVAWEHTYSCYEETDPNDPAPCGECPACEERTEAFEKAGIEDPYAPPA